MRTTRFRGFSSGNLPRVGGLLCESGQIQLPVLSGAAWDGYFARPVPDDSPSDGARVDGRDDKEFFHLFSWGRVPGEVSGRAAEYRTLAMSLGATLLGWWGDGTPDPVAANSRCRWPKRSLAARRRHSCGSCATRRSVTSGLQRDARRDS